MSSAVRSLAATVVLGSTLIYTTGGLDSPNARAMAGVIAVCFLLFWVTFFFMFAPRVPKYDGRREESELDSATNLVIRGRRRRETDGSESETNGSSAGESQGGGD